MSVIAKTFRYFFRKQLYDYTSDIIVSRSVVNYSKHILFTGKVWPGCKRQPLVQDDDHSSSGDDRSSGTEASTSFLRRNRRCFVILTFLMLAFVITLVVMIVMLPQIAQVFVNQSRISFQSINIMQPNETHFQSHIIGRIENAGPFSATILPFTLEVHHQDELIGSLDLNQIYLSYGHADLDLNGVFSIGNVTAFTSFAETLMKADSFTWRLLGAAELSLFGHRIPRMRMDKNVDLSGMRRFAGARVDNLTLQDGNQTDTQNSSGSITRSMARTQLGLPVPSNSSTFLATHLNATLINPSIVSIEVGDLSMQIFYQNIKLGTVTAPNVTIHSGINQLQLQGRLDPPSSPNSSAYSNLFSQYVGGFESQLSVRASPLSASAPSWLLKAMDAIEIQVTFPGDVNPLSIVRRIDLQQVTIDFASDLLVPHLSVKQLNVNFATPFDFHISVEAIQQTFCLYYKSLPIGEVNSTFFPASNTVEPLLIQSSFDKLPLTVSTAQSAGFSDFLVDLFQNGEMEYRIAGNASLKAFTSVGQVTLLTVQFDSIVKVHGLQALHVVSPSLAGNITISSPPSNTTNSSSPSIVPTPQFNTSIKPASNPVILNATIDHGSVNALQMRADIIIFSNSSVAAELGDIYLDLMLNESVIGITLLRNFTLAPGNNFITCFCIYDPVTAEAKMLGVDMLSRYVNGHPTLLRMKGRLGNSTASVFLNRSMSQIDLIAPLNGLSLPLVQHANIHINPLTVSFTREAFSNFRLVNPFGESLSLVSMDTTIQMNGSTLATQRVSVTNSSSALVVNANATVSSGDSPAPALAFVAGNSAMETKYFSTNMIDPLGAASLSALGQGIMHDLHLNVNGTIGVIIGAFFVLLHYDQRNLSTSLSLI